MNCDECKEQLLELIEREAVDPQGVREILAKCPDCREAFDQMKATLALAAQLPVEAPSSAIDAAILRAAAARSPHIAPLPKRRLQPLPWAMAAIALLAVGVGVWAIPREVQMESDAAPTGPTTVRETVTAEPMLGDEAEAEEVIDQAEPAAETAARNRSGELASAKARKAPRRSAREKRPSSPSANELKGARMAETPASQPASDVAAGAAAESLSAEADSTALRVRKKEQEDDATATCRRKISEIVRRKHDDKDYVPAPEEELAIGKCYQMLDQAAEARKWLRRAAAHPETRARAEKALGELAPE